MPSENSYFSLDEAAKILGQNEVVLLEWAATQQITLLLRVPSGYETRIKYPAEFIKQYFPISTRAIKKLGHGVFNFVELDYKQVRTMQLHNGQTHITGDFSTAYLIDENARLLKVENTIKCVFQVTPYNHSEEMVSIIESNKDTRVSFTIQPINKSLDENALINCTDVYLTASDVERLKVNESVVSESQVVRASPSWHDEARELAVQTKTDNPKFIQKQIVPIILKELNKKGYKNKRGGVLTEATITRIAFQKNR